MKIYEVEFRNRRYSGEMNKSVQVRAENTEKALATAKIYAKRDEDRFYNFRNWEVIKIELVAETEN